MKPFKEAMWEVTFTEPSTELRNSKRVATTANNDLDVERTPYTCKRSEPGKWNRLSACVNLMVVEIST